MILWGALIRSRSEANLVHGNLLAFLRQCGSGHLAGGFWGYFSNVREWKTNSH